MRKTTSLLLVIVIALGCLFVLSSCFSSPNIFSGDEDYELYSGYWEIATYDFAELGKIDGDTIEDYAEAFNNYDEIIDYIHIFGIKDSDSDKRILTANIHYLNGSGSGMKVITSIDNGIRIGEMNLIWENDLLVGGNEKLKIYLQKVEKIED